MRHLSLQTEYFPIAGSFRIAHGSVTDVTVVTVGLQEGDKCGFGECRPYPRYNETAQSVTAQIESIQGELEAGLTRRGLQELLPAGAARNAVDCALWDLEAKITDVPVWQALGLTRPQSVPTAFTLSIDTPSAMAAAAIAARDYNLLKIKIKDMSGLEAAQRILGVRPDVSLIIDANEALNSDELAQFRSALTGAPIALIEQPIPAGQLSHHPQAPNALPLLCADESLHTRDDLGMIWDAGYRAVNIKLDKCGGLTEGVELFKDAKAHGFQIMAGCMVGTSLAMAPMLMLASLADYVDLDGPALLANDRDNAIQYKAGRVHPPSRALWG